PQQLRRLDRPRAQDHFPRRRYRLAAGEPHARGAPAGELHPLDGGHGPYGEIGPVAGRLEERRRRTLSPAAPDVAGGVAAAVAGRGVEVMPRGNAEFPARGDDGVEERHPEGVGGDPERAVTATGLVGAELMALDLAPRRQEILPAPALQAPA